MLGYSVESQVLARIVERKESETGFIFHYLYKPTRPFVKFFGTYFLRLLLYT